MAHKGCLKLKSIAGNYKTQPAKDQWGIIIKETLK